MAKCLLKRSKRGHWNIECGDSEYFSLGVISRAGASVSEVTSALTSKYQKKLTKVTKLVDTITSAILKSVFETSVSKALDNGEIDDREFDMLQELQLKVIKELANINRKMESETRAQLRNKENLRKRDA